MYLPKGALRAAFFNHPLATGNGASSIAASATPSRQPLCCENGCKDEHNGCKDEHNGNAIIEQLNIVSAKLNAYVATTHLHQLTQ